MRDKRKILPFSVALAFSILAVPMDVFAEGLSFTEDFRDSALNLIWVPFPGFNDNSLTPILETDTPEGDMWAGRQTNEQLGGFASMSYAGAANLRDYTMEAWVYTIVVPEGKAPLNGIAVRVDPENGRFYRLASNFDGEPSLTFAYVGGDTNNYPVYLGTWRESEVSGGLPNQSGWHRMGIKCVGSSFWLYWDGQELPGCPLTDKRIDKGFFGIYANYVGGKGIVETKVDAIKVTVNVSPTRP